MEKKKDYAATDKLVKLLDSQFRIPGTNIRFGLDGIIGLFPVAGDFISFLFSGLLTLKMVKKGVSGKVVLLMLGNIILDWIIGSIPVLGDVADFFFKANERNATLLREYQEEGKHKGSGIGIIIGILLAVGALVFLIIYAIVKIIEFLGALFG